MPNYHIKSKIVKREELIPPGRLAEGMIISFRYSSGSDKTPLVLVLNNDKEKKMIEGINLNYITMEFLTDKQEEQILIISDILNESNVWGQIEDKLNIELDSEALLFKKPSIDSLIYFDLEILLTIAKSFLLKESIFL